MDMSNENVFLCFSHGFQVRNFLQTKFIHSLTGSYQVVIIINEADKGYLTKFIERLQLKNITIEGVTVCKRSYEELFIFIRKNIFIHPDRARTRNILNEMNKKKLGSLYKITSFLNKLVGRFEFMRSLWRGVEGMLITGWEFEALLKKYKPGKVITGNYGTEPFEIRLLRAARRLRIKSLAVVPSWDNLTSKGVMGVKPDYLTVWNDIMEQEAIELHAFKKERVFVTGPLQFDNFFDPAYRIVKDLFYSKFKIEQNRPIITFGTITPKYFKYNLEVLYILKDLIEKNEIRGNPKVLVRIHPQVVKDPVFGDNMEQYYTLQKSSDIFCLSIPDVEEWASISIPKETDYTELISALTYSTICISSASSLIFDSCACNTCFIGVGFDGNDKGLPYHQSVRRMFDFEHYRHVVALGGFYIAESREELAQYINAYLDNPEIHKKEREQTLQEQIKFCDGKNYQRVMEAVKSI